MPFGYLTDIGRGVQSDMRAIQPHKELRANRDYTARAIEEAQAAADRRIQEEEEAKALKESEGERARQAAVDVLAGEAFAEQRANVAKYTPSEAESAKAWDALRAKHAAVTAELQSKGMMEQKDLEAAMRPILEEKQALQQKYGTPPKSSAYGRDEEFKRLQAEISGPDKSKSNASSWKQGGSSADIRQQAEQFLASQWLAQGKEPRDVRRDLYVAELLEGRRPDILRDMVGTTGSDLVDQEIARRRGLTKQAEDDNDKIVAARIRAAEGVSKSSISAESYAARTEAMSARDEWKRKVAEARVLLEQGRLTNDVRKTVLDSVNKALDRQMRLAITMEQEANRGVMRDVLTGGLPDRQNQLDNMRREIARVQSTASQAFRDLYSDDPAVQSRAIASLASLASDPQVERAATMSDPTIFTTMGISSQEQVMPGYQASKFAVDPVSGTFSLQGGGGDWSRTYVTGAPGGAGPAAPAGGPAKPEGKKTDKPPRKPNRGAKKDRKPEGW